MKTILMIEDDPLIARVYKTQIEKAGFQLQVADTAEAGLLALSTARPDLVLLDLMLPAISGVEILKRLRADASLAGLPVFVLTAVNFSDLAREAAQAGANRVFDKAKIIPLDILDAIEEDGIFDPTPAARAC
ncbi:MAG: response regulator [Verrucomicrobia bacterium]|nr:response regulator [Verrucomicrobiota bacterium]